MNGGDEACAAFCRDRIEEVTVKLLVGCERSIPPGATVETRARAVARKMVECTAVVRRVENRGVHDEKSKHCFESRDQKEALGVKLGKRKESQWAVGLDVCSLFRQWQCYDE